MTRILFTLFLVLNFSLLVKADPLPKNQRINGSLVKTALHELAGDIHKSIVLVSALDNSPAAHGVVVSEDGLIITKASELSNKDIQVILPNQKRYHTVVVGQDKDTDLALLKINEKGLTPIDFSGDFPQDKASWLLSPLYGLDSKIGIVSSISRDIKRVSGVIGIVLGEDTSKGIVITKAVEKGPAHTAGVRDGDVLLKVDGKTMVKKEALLNYLKDKSPGTKVEIIVNQDNRELTRSITLGDRNQTFGLFNRNLEMSGVVSKRTDGFRQVVQHDIPLEHYETGGPLMDINGKVIGLNIAKANRSEAYALPNSEVRAAIKRLKKLKIPNANTKFQGAKHVSLVQLKTIQSELKTLLPEVSKSTVGLIINGASGSGVIVSEDGYILTAAHVSQQPGSKVTVIMPDGKKYKGKSLGNHIRGDVGLVKITEKGKFPFVKMGKSVLHKTGDWCFALGYPGGFNKERGAVLRIGKIIEIRPNVIWTDCTLLGGDSGGPLFNFKGEVIGINSRIFNTSEDNLHGPVDIIKDHWDEMVDGKSLKLGRSFMNKAFLGVATERSGDELKIVEVVPDSAADEAGLRVGDSIQEIDDVDLDSTRALISELRKKEVGDEITINIIRDSKEMTLKAKLKPRP